MHYIKLDLNHIFEELGKELQSINIERFVSMKEADGCFSSPFYVVSIYYKLIDAINYDNSRLG
jgi:hypothetical protein